MAYFFTSDTHFSSLSTIKREMRPFNSTKAFDNYVIKTWNKQVKNTDIIYHLGDFINYNKYDTKTWKKSISLVSKIKCPTILIIGNNEERLIQDYFNNNFEKFKGYAKSVGFKDVKTEEYITFYKKNFYLNHYPSKHKENYINLFGHTHRATGIWKPYGLNVGCDLYYFKLLSEKDIDRLLIKKALYWDNDKGNFDL